MAIGEYIEIKTTRTYLIWFGFNEPNQKKLKPYESPEVTIEVRRFPYFPCGHDHIGSTCIKGGKDGDWVDESKKREKDHTSEFKLPLIGKTLYLKIDIIEKSQSRKVTVEYECDVKDDE